MSADHAEQPPPDNDHAVNPRLPPEEHVRQVQDKVIRVLQLEFGDFIAHLDIEDLFQQAVLELMDSATPFEFRTLPELERWLITTAKRIGWQAVEGKAKQRLRNPQPVSSDLPGDDTSPSRKVRRSERAHRTTQLIATEIERLSLPLREAMERDLDGMSTQEIADDLGIRAETVRRRLSDARRQITNSLLQLGISRSDVLPT